VQTPKKRSTWPRSRRSRPWQTCFGCASKLPGRICLSLRHRGAAAVIVQEARRLALDPPSGENGRAERTVVCGCGATINGCPNAAPNAASMPGNQSHASGQPMGDATFRPVMAATRVANEACTPAAISER